MDGVLTDFDGSFEARFGMPPKALPRPELWEKVLNTKDYWYDLPKKADADKLINYLNKFGYSILTGLPAVRHWHTMLPPLAYDGIGKNTVCQRQNHRMPAHLTYNIFLSASRTFVIKKK